MDNFKCVFIHLSTCLRCMEKGHFHMINFNLLNSKKAATAEEPLNSVTTGLQPKRPLVCDTCQKEFYFPSQYAVHMKTHTGMKKIF